MIKVTDVKITDIGFAAIDKLMFADFGSTMSI